MNDLVSALLQASLAISFYCGMTVLLISLVA